MSYRPRRPPRVESVTLRGVEHHLTRWGPAGDPPLVFLHGFLDTSDTFQFMVDAFAADLPILAPDWRGFGSSAWHGTSYWFPDYLADLDALLGWLSPSAPVVLLGHSMGGNIAGLYAGIRPERVARLVSLEGFGLPAIDATRAPDRYRLWLGQLADPPAFPRFDSVERFAAVLQRKNPRLTAERAAFVAARWSRPLAEGGYTVSADPLHKLVNPILYRREEVAACWRRCTAPVLFVAGGRSEFRASMGADGTDAALGALCDDVRLATLPEAGHMMHHEVPEAVAALVEPFLRGAG